MKNFQRLAAWTALGLFAFGVVAVIALRIGFNAYLNSESFRKKMAMATSRTLKAEGEFMPLHLSAPTIYSDGFTARGTSAAFFSDLHADQIRADFNWRGLLHKTWQIDQIELQRLDIRIAERPPEPRPHEPSEQITKPVSGGWTLDLRKAFVRESRWSWGGPGTPAGTVTGAALALTPAGDAWLIDVQGGKIAEAGWPDLQIESAHLRYRSPSLFITESTLRNGEGTLTATGEIDFQRGADLQMQIAAMNITPMLANDWRARLTGKLFGDAKVRAPLGGSGDGLTVEGSVRLADGQLTALPVLDQIATFTRTQRFRQMPLSKASADFSRDNAKIVARNVIVESEGLMRVEGACTIANGQIDGTFQVGVTPASLQWLPGSQSRVFTVARGGYLWTSMRLTGPVDHPTEDLTQRLVAAAAGEMIKDVEGTVREATKGVLDLLLQR